MSTTQNASRGSAGKPTEPYRLEYERIHGGAPAAAPHWLAQVRERAMDSFQSLGFPTTRDEEWRFTSIAAVAERAFTMNPALPDRPTPVQMRRFRPAPIGGVELVFVNGRYVPALSSVETLPDGALVGSLSSVLAADPGEIQRHLAKLAPTERRPFTALNTAFLADGACIRLAPHTILREPIHLLFVAVDSAVGESTMSHPRTLIVMGEGCQASIVERYAGDDTGRYFTNAVTEIDLGEDAALEHFKVQRESVLGCHIGSVHVRASRGARFTSYSFSLGGSLVRNDVVAVLDGEGADCVLNGLYIADAERHVDNHTTIDHARPHCGSREVYKGILADRARGVFHGRIVVRPQAQQTDARQTNRALLLSDEARINTKPQLEIFANDVKCTHGAAVGQLDDEAVFYLRSRGLSHAEARRLLIDAFMGEVLGHVRLEAIRADIEQVIAAQLSRTLKAA